MYVYIYIYHYNNNNHHHHHHEPRGTPAAAGGRPRAPRTAFAANTCRLMCQNNGCMFNNK